jgi:hypothetical protein
MKIARHNWFTTTALAVVLAIVACPARAAAPASETELKAVLLFHITQFVTWPSNASPQSDFTIGVLGSDALEAALKSVVEGETVDKHPIRVIKSNNPADLRDCDLLYVSPTVRQPLTRVLEEMKRRPSTLIVGETEGFLEQGGHIRLRQTPARKIRLQVHLGNARGNGFQISAQLLRVADVVRGGNG